MNKETKAKICCIAIIILEVFATIVHKLTGHQIFLYYTLDANILAAVSAALYLAWTGSGKDMTRQQKDVLQYLRFLATSSLVFTMIIVLFVLVPLNIKNGTWPTLLFGPAATLHHIICPILSLVSFLRFETHDRIQVRMCLYAILPTLAYAIVLLILNAMRVVYGPYVFLHVYEQPVYMSVVWCVVIVAVNLIVTFAVRKVDKRV